MFFRSWIVLFLLAIVLSVPGFTDSDYTFGIFKLIWYIQAYLVYSSLLNKIKTAICRGRQQSNLKIEEHKTTKSPGRVAVPEIVRCFDFVYLHRLFHMYMNGKPFEISRG
jgi:hypothetical protein